ncbi:CLUMA_CG014386, isoform A [Clunio marinus]|uniref:CLUMA_CG014386, isoform A n=1 Tax=Clunio marinus TaxID=568069 RepID=A0A1J1IMM3_9DIPT|nr:CLUMA_CG014386, isoform A [Clunio marinus]
MILNVIDNFLSTSENRVIYETLWNLAITKNFKSVNDEISIITVCNLLMNEMVDNDLDRNKFYFSTQLTYGVVKLYRFQIDKLLAQVKIALHRSVKTVYEINWLSNLTQNSTSKNENQTKNASNRKQKTKDKVSHTNKNLSIDLIEQAFTIQEDPEIDQNIEKNGRRDSSMPPPDNCDPTMATNMDAITLTENQRFSSVNINLNESYDEFETTRGKSFPQSFTDDMVRQDQSTLEEIRNNSDQFVNIPQQNSLINDIEEILSSHQVSSARFRDSHKRRLVFTPEDSSQLRKSPKMFKGSEVSLEEMPMVVNDNSRFESSNQTENVKEVNISLGEKSVTFIDIPPFEASNENGYVNQINELCDLPSNDIIQHKETEETNNSEEFLPLSEFQTPIDRDKRSHKKRLIIDKNISINEYNKKCSEYYTNKLTFESPLDSFAMRYFYIKSSVENFLSSPSSRLKHGARNLLPLFERNLKRISLKRSLNAPSPSDVLIAAKKQKLSENIAENHKNINNFNELESNVDVVEEVPSKRRRTENIQGEENNLQIEFNNQIPDIQPEVEQQKDFYEYNAKTKWSKQDIMKTLKTFWEQDEHSITMSKLCAKTNRFTAAGIFFELMVLSKKGAVELLQTNDGLEITNILPGANAQLHI